MASANTAGFMTFSSCARTSGLCVSPARSMLRARTKCASPWRKTRVSACTRKRARAQLSDSKAYPLLYITWSSRAPTERSSGATGGAAADAAADAAAADAAAADAGAAPPRAGVPVGDPGSGCAVGGDEGVAASAAAAARGRAVSPGGGGCGGRRAARSAAAAVISRHWACSRADMSSEAPAVKMCSLP